MAFSFYLGWWKSFNKFVHSNRKKWIKSNKNDVARTMNNAWIFIWRAYFTVHLIVRSPIILFSFTLIKSIQVVIYPTHKNCRTALWSVQRERERDRVTVDALICKISLPPSDSTDDLTVASLLYSSSGHSLYAQYQTPYWQLIGSHKLKCICLSDYDILRFINWNSQGNLQSYGYFVCQSSATFDIAPWNWIHNQIYE